MIKPYIKNETAVEIICSICDKTRADCEPADCKWMKKLEEESVDAEPVVRCIDGTCPVANREEYVERGFDTVRNCYECPEEMSCETCYHKGSNCCPEEGVKQAILEIAEEGKDEK